MSDWINICPQTDIGAGQARLVEHAGLKIAVYNLDGEYFALEDFCSHDQFPLLGCGLPHDLLIHGEEITCPRHGARFSIRTGVALCAPAYEPVATFPVRVADGMVQIQCRSDD